jgi:hypothetical protein
MRAINRRVARSLPVFESDERGHVPDGGRLVSILRPWAATLAHSAFRLPVRLWSQAVGNSAMLAERAVITGIGSKLYTRSMGALQGKAS